MESRHSKYSKIYLYTLVNDGRFDEAYKYAKKIEKINLDNTESDLIIGIYYLKNNKLNLSAKYFQKFKNRNSRNSVQKLINISLLNWLSYENISKNDAKKTLELIPSNFENIKKIQDAFIECFYNSPNTEKIFKKLINDKKTNFERYNFFYANYLVSKGNHNKAKKVIRESLSLNPRNLLLNQFYTDISSKNKNNYKNNFNCKNLSHVVAELFYIMSNALSSQSAYQASNFYLNLAKYLNPKFISFETLYAENFLMIKNFSKSKSVYDKIMKSGNSYEWHASKQIAYIFEKQKKKEDSLKFLKSSYGNIPKPSVYQTYDYAQFLKNNEKFDAAIKYYTEVISRIKKDHELYSKVTEGRGVAYERLGKWKEAEKDLLSSLSVSPNQAYVINYLAYTWIEKGIKINESLKMLETANNLKKGDGYIIDSLGWALFKLKRYDQAKDYLQTAVTIMPTDPTVNDHYGDSLWMNGNKIQARYYWEYILTLEDDVSKNLKKRIKKKLLFGI